MRLQKKKIKRTTGPLNICLSLVEWTQARWDVGHTDSVKRYDMYREKSRDDNQQRQIHLNVHVPWGRGDEVNTFLILTIWISAAVTAKSLWNVWFWHLAIKRCLLIYSNFPSSVCSIQNPNLNISSSLRKNIHDIQVY